MNIKDFLNFRKWLFCGLLNPQKDSWLYKQADCQRYEEPEEPEIEVEICTETLKKATEWCRSAGTAELRKFKESEAPTDFCELHKDPDPLIDVWVCLATRKKPLKSCRVTGYVQMRKSEAPINFCKIHKLPKKIKNPYFDHDGLGLFLDFMEHAWNPKKQAETEQRIMNYLGFIGGEGVNVAAFFSYLHTNKNAHKHLNWKIPFMAVDTPDGKKADLSKVNQRYYELIDRFAELLSIAKIKPQIIAEMARYTFWIYENNVNGVPNFWHEKARPFQQKHIHRLIEIFLRYFEIEDIEIVPINEASHGGSDESGHLIANYHKAIWLFCETLGLPLKNFWADTSESEFARSQLVFHGWNNGCLNCEYKWTDKIEDLKTASCPNCGHAGFDPAESKFWIERSYDCPKCHSYLWDNIERYGRDCAAIGHGVSISEDLERGHKSFLAWLGSGNWRVKWTEDGSNNPNCEGYVMGHGYPWRLGSAEQIKEMLIYVWTECKNAKGKKVFIWGIYPMEQILIHEWGLQSYYSVSTVNKDRFAAVREAYQAVFGD
jgi:hypothetical protein